MSGSLGVRAVAALRTGDDSAARSLVVPLLARTGGDEVTGLEFTSDEYALNSVSGLVRYADGRRLFFKLHAEEGEEQQVEEYYRAHLLARAGLPVEVPVAVSGIPGEQVVLYEVRREERMVDVCLAQERSEPEEPCLPEDWAAARRELDHAVGRVLTTSIRPAGPESASAAIHQLFHRRLADRDGHLGGTRFSRFYADSPLWRRLSSKRWQVGAARYGVPLGELVQQAAGVLAPETLAAGPMVTAHGDDHHGNIWCRRHEDGSAYLTLFDPAFAGDDIPALLALVKPTYHNALAHPFWLYHPGEVPELKVTETADEVRVAEPWRLSPLRQEVLDSVVDHAWIPLARELAHRGELPADWRRTVRLALMLCPLLVTNLTARHRGPDAALLGLLQVAVAGNEPTNGSDPLTGALDRIERAVEGVGDRAAG